MQALSMTPGERRPRGKALVVDDGPCSRAIAKALLEEDHYDVETAENGAQALDALRTSLRDYDFLLMDLDMPVLDGFAAAQAIRSLDEPRSGVPILAFSSKTAAAEIERAFAAGMDGYIGKPFDPQAFTRSIRECLQDAEEARLARQRSGAASCPVWNRRVFDDLCQRLHADRTARIVAMFTERLEQAQTLLASPTLTREQLAFDAHGLISAAGLLGFEALCATAHKVQAGLQETSHAMDAAVWTGLGAELHEAIGRALQVSLLRVPNPTIGRSA